MKDNKWSVLNKKNKQSFLIESTWEINTRKKKLKSISKDKENEEKMQVTFH